MKRAARCAVKAGGRCRTCSGIGPTAMKEAFRLFAASGILQISVCWQANRFPAAMLKIVRFYRWHYCSVAVITLQDNIIQASHSFECAQKVVDSVEIQLKNHAGISLQGGPLLADSRRQKQSAMASDPVITLSGKNLRYTRSKFQGAIFPASIGPTAIRHHNVCTFMV